MKTTINHAFATALALAGALPGWTLDITGKVVDKLEAPVAGAQICVQGGAACANSGSDGAFHLTGSSALRPEDKLTRGFVMDLRGGRPVLQSPMAGAARFEWFDAGGRRLSGRDAALTAGRNEIDLAAPAGRGLHFLRLALGNMTVTWKAMLEAVGNGAQTSAVAALAKASAAGSLQCSKGGYATRTYNPSADVETGVVIMLGDEKDVALFDGKTLDGWSGNPAMWSVKDSAIDGKTDKGGYLIYTKDDYSDFRLFLRSRMRTTTQHLGICFWGTRQSNWGYGECMLVIPPDGGQWDYHSGKGGVSRQIPKPAASLIPDRMEWHYNEILVKRSTGEIHMAINGTEMIRYKDSDPSRMKVGPIGLQIHAGSSEVQYKDVFVEVNPTDMTFKTLKK
jgi:hypothetical protein